MAVLTAQFDRTPVFPLSVRGRLLRVGWLWYLLAASAVSVFYWVLSPSLSKLIIWPLIGWSSVAAILLGIRINRPETKAPWFFLAAGTALFIFGDNLYTFRAQIQHNADAMFPSYVDVVYLAMYPMMIAGLARLVRCRTRNRDWAAVIDAAIITGAVGLLAWVLLIDPYISGSDMTILARLTSIAYPLGDIALLAVTVRLAVGGGGRSRAFMLLAGSITFLIIADSLYGYMNLAGLWHEHNPVDAAWMVFYIGWGAAALHPSMTVLTEPAKSQAALRTGRLLLIGAAALMPPCLLLVEQVTGGVQDGVAIGLAAIGLFLLVLIRIAGLSREVAERHGEARFRALIQNASDATLVIDSLGLVTYQTPSAARVLGAAGMGLEGKAIGDLLHPADREKLRLLLTRPDRMGSIEWRMRDGEGGWRYLDVVAADLRGEPSVGGVALTVRDSTERKRLSAEREAALVHANEASRQKSVFLANMSHEIRTPLNGVMGMLGLLASTPLDDEQRDYTDTMTDSAESLAAIVNDVLDFSQIEAGRLDVDSQPFALRPAVEAALSGSASAAEAKGLELIATIEDDVPSVVIGDRLRLRQVLANLVSNATKFTDAGEVVVTVRRDGEGLRFEIADTGIGIVDGARERLFDPYVQADDSTTRRHGGSGLGLTISKQLVELMGGTIGVDSEPGAGSTFWFTVAFAAGACDDASLASRSRLAEVTALVVSAQPALCTSVTAMLRKWAVQASSVGDAESALQHLAAAVARGRACDVVVADVDLGGMGQLEFARRVHALDGLRTTRLIMLATRRARVPKGAETLADGVVTKPVRGSAMFDSLVDALDAAEPAVGERAPTQRRDRVEPACGHILVVEDNAVNQKVAVALLKQIGYTVDVAADGIEALDAMERRTYDVVLMDCQMPRLDGYEATAEIRRREVGTRTPIVAMTASAMSSDRDRCLAVGMDEYLAKPIDRDSLAALLSTFIKQPDDGRCVLVPSAGAASAAS